MNERPASTAALGGVVRLHAVGESALLVEPTDARGVLDLYRRLRASAPGIVTELVPAAATVLVMFEAGSRGAIAAWVERVAGEAAAAEAAAAAVVDGVVEIDRVVDIAVRYDGADLAAVAELTGTSVDGVISAHLEQLWTAAFIGFAPGFAYLQGEDDRLTVPRRDTPRAVVPAGSVALAAGYCGIYPRESPGGWHLIGRSEVVLWDAQRADPALLAPGTRVRFVREG